MLSMPFVMTESANLLPQISLIVVAVSVPVLILIAFFAAVVFQYQIWQNTKAIRRELEALVGGRAEEPAELAAEIDRDHDDRHRQRSRRS